MLPSEVGALEGKAGMIAARLRSLSHDARLLVLCQLVKHKEMTAGSLTGIGGLSQSALSQHLARMREDGIIAYRRDGQTLWYRIADEKIERLMGELYQLYCAVDA
jgi:DNA-binding transcriptional ArsR family regulator